MDRTKFTGRKTGQLIELQGAFGRDWAFVPDHLPPDWAFPATLWPLLDEASSALMQLDGAGKHIPNPNLVIQPLQMREAVRSSRLEGTFAEPEEVILFEMNPRAPKSDRDEANDWLEVSNYRRALAYGTKLISEGEMVSCELIRGLHRMLLTGVRGKDKQPGEFRQVQVQIDSNARFIPPPVSDMEKCLASLENVLNVNPREFDPPIHPLVWCYLVHYQFETIHPFRDGNGRIGRVLLALMTYRHMELGLPWLYMSSYYDRYKEEYKNNLFECSSDGRWDQWIEYCLHGTIVQARDSVRRLDGLLALQREYHTHVDSCGPRYHAIIEGLFMRPILTAPDLQKDYQISWPTAKSDIDTLIRNQILEPLPGSRKPKVYFAPSIYQIAYGEELDAAAG